jgi:hypothetical protein
MGGTEMRVLAGHAGKLYAGNGYWEDTPGPEGRQGSQILVLDAPGGRWQIDHDFDERMPDGRRRDLAVSALDEVRFETDANGKPLSAPVSLLIVANWDLIILLPALSRSEALVRETREPRVRIRLPPAASQQRTARLLETAAGSRHLGSFIGSPS